MQNVMHHNKPSQLFRIQTIGGIPMIFDDIRVSLLTDNSVYQPCRFFFFYQSFKRV